MTISKNPWREIQRVAKRHSCRSLVLGVNKLDAHSLSPLLNQFEGDIAILNSKENLSLPEIKRILVPVGGNISHDSLRAKVLGTIMRNSKLEDICYLTVVKDCLSRKKTERLEKKLKEKIEDEAGGLGRVKIAYSDNPIESIAQESKDYQLSLLGLSILKDRNVAFNDFSIELLKNIQCSTLIIGRS